MNTQIYIILKLFKDCFIILIDMNAEFFNMLVKNQSNWSNQYKQQKKQKLKEYQAYQREMSPQWRAQQKILRLKYEGKI